MQCLIDADILCYQLAFGAVYTDEKSGEKRTRGWDSVEEALLQTIKEIEEECMADEPSKFYLTLSERHYEQYRRHKRREGEEVEDYKPNFRIGAAKTQTYKGGRKQEKPFHHDNLVSYFIHHLDGIVLNGFEADDAISIEMVKAAKEGREVVCCSTDKDLAITQGLHYKWPVGKRAGVGPFTVDKMGTLELKGSTLKGTGLKFFYSQMLTGDKVDNIGGLQGVGPAKAYRALVDCETEEDCREVILDMYKEKVGDDWEAYAEEQSTLLWMVNELDEEGKGVPYNILGTAEDKIT